jgi:hypothetical protein
MKKVIVETTPEMDALNAYASKFVETQPVVTPIGGR